MHVDDTGAHTQTHLYATTGVVWVSYRHGASFCKLRRIALHHFLIHDEATRTQHHTFGGAVATLFHVLANHETHNPLLWSKLIDDESQCSGLKVHIDIPLLNRFSEYFHK